MQSIKIILITSAIVLIGAFPLYSHGAEYTVLSDKVIRIQVNYDTGEIFSGADVLVFPPGKSKPAYTLKTDNEGSFYFQPDREGDWILQVRGEGGHGKRINMTIGKNMISRGSEPGSPGILQKLIMVLSIIWGTVGTVLYFRNRY